MAVFSIANLAVRAVSVAVPAQRVRNEDLHLLNDSEGKRFVQAIGINSRRVAPPSICASDLCVAAARRIIDRLELRPAEIGVLIFVTQTPDYPLPGNSMLAQHRLGLPATTYLVDLNQGCAGYVYGLASLAALMKATNIDKGLLLVGDTLTRILSPEDRSTYPIFSDAGSATLVEHSPDADRMHFSLGTEGDGADVIRVGCGGARRPFGAESLVMNEEGPNVARAPVHLSMQGMDVLHYCLTYVAPSIAELLAFANADIDTPDYYVFHQANKIVNESLIRRLGVPPEKAPETLSEYGNTSSATIPLTICERLRDVLAHDSKTLLLSGFGAGFSWGTALINADSVVCAEPVELDERYGT